MAAKTPKYATIGCIIAGLLTFIVGVPFSFSGAITRAAYGPDSIYASFTADTCSKILDLPQCAAWEPDPSAFLHLLTHDLPTWIGAWCLIAIVAASMSTSDGSILAMSTVAAHNLARKMGCSSDSTLLLVARLMTIPVTAGAIAIGVFYQSDHPSGATGYLLIVAFDICLAGVIVALFAAFYTKKPSASAALASIIAGCITRVVLEFVLPKDGWFIFPFDGDEFLDYGAVSSDLLPTWFDAPSNLHWDPETCEQGRFEDYTGIDSLSSPVVAFITYVLVSTIAPDSTFGLPKSWMTPVPAPEVAEAPADKE